MTTQLLIRRLATFGAVTVLMAATTTFGGTATAFADPGGGANAGCGDYCPTTPGAPSGNGNGNGNDPAQGTVGNADDKNPPGQFKNGGDPNGGFECDQNNGIAQGNPAHTGCAPTPPPTPQPDCTPAAANNFCGTPSNPPTPTPTCTPAAANNFCGTPPTTTCATTNTCPTDNTPGLTPGVPAPVPPVVVPPDAPVPGVGGTVQHVPVPHAPQVLGQKITRVLGTKIVKRTTPTTPRVAATKISALPFTGAPIGRYLQLALTALGLGFVLMLAGRRRYRPRFA